MKGIFLFESKTLHKYFSKYIDREKGMLNLIPIDHGLSFPDSFQACTYDVVWMEWPQTKKKWMPLELDYISKIDPKADVEKLSKHFKFRDVPNSSFYQLLISLL